MEGFDLSDDAVLLRLVESVRTLAADPETYEKQSRFRPLGARSASDGALRHEAGRDPRARA